MIEISCSDYTFPLLPRARRFALLALLGFRYVDLGLFARSLDLKPAQLAADPNTFIESLLSDLRVAGLNVADVFLQTGEEPACAAANDPSSRIRAGNRKLFLHALKLCSAVDCRHLTGLPGVRHGGIEEKVDLALALKEGAWRQQTAQRAGVQYAIEPHIGSLCADVASARSFVESVSGLSLALDYGHFVAAGIPAASVHALLPFASHLHARAGMRDQLQVTLGENAIDFAAVVRRLQQQEYRGFVAIEYVWTEWRHCNRVDNVSETILLRNLFGDLLGSSRKSALRRRKSDV